MPKGWDLVMLRMPRGIKKCFEHGHVAYQIYEDGEQNRMQTDDLGVGSNIIKFQIQ